MESILAPRALRPAQHAHPDVSEAISLDSGYGFPGVFPDLIEAAHRALTTYRSESLQYGKPFGLAPLRDWISAYITEDGVRLNPDEILIVNGAKNGIDLLCRLFTQDGDAIVVTAPTYFTSIPIFQSFGLEFVEVRQDAEGMDVEALAGQLADRARRGLPQPKFIYDVPDFHNPTGITMSRQRREALLALASSRKIAIVEDSPYRRLRFEGNAEPPLKALDGDGVVFTVGTFSKLLAPGLRVGWIGAPRPMLERLARLKSDGGTCPLTQRIIFEFCKAGNLDAHLERARSAYSAHRDAMMAALRRALPEVEFVPPSGGYYLWVKFPPNVDTGLLAERAAAGGVSVIAGRAFFAGKAAYADGRDEPSRYVRIAYSRANPEEIEEGIGRLTAAYRSMR